MEDTQGSILHRHGTRSALKNIPKVTAVVDQASNMRLALRLSKRVRTLDEGSIQCIDHKLNTALQKSSEANEILYDAFTRARNLARRVHQSVHSMTELEEACLQLKTECLKLPLICPTRWNCHHKMITALKRMKEPLHNSDFEKLLPTEDEFEYSLVPNRRGGWNKRGGGVGNITKT